MSASRRLATRLVWGAGASALAMIVAAIWLAARGELFPQSRRLDGDWIVRLPGGAEQRVTLTRQADGSFLLGRLVFAGVYELAGGELVLRSPLYGDDAGAFRWRVEDDASLTLVAEPQGAGSGTYVGTRMERESARDGETSAGVGASNSSISE